MSWMVFAFVLAALTSLGWGMIAPMAVKMNQATQGNVHPTQLFLWNTLGNMFFSIVILLATNFAPVKTWTWHWSGWVVFFAWSGASLAITLAFYLAPDKAAVTNAIAATYPAMVSAMILWYFFGEIMSLQKIAGLGVIVIGVIMVLLA